MELTPAEIRSQQFDQVRRGFDPQEVGVFLERVSAMLAARDKTIEARDAEITRLERALEEARAAEEAVRLTMVAATKAKDEILSGASDDAGRLVDSARSEASAIIDDARREALSVLEESRRNAEDVMEAARLEQVQLEERIALTRDALMKTGTLLKGMASGALEDVGRAHALLDGIGGDVDLDALGVVLESTRASGLALDDPVDRLLAQLREVGG